MEREQLTATVRAAQQGDEKALNLLFNTYYNDVYYFALKTLKDEDLACDITQETFVEIINTLQDLKEPAAFVTWMRQVTYHQCTRYFKKKKEVLVEEDEDGNSVFDTMEEERAEFIPGESVDKEDFRATILALLDTLSEEQRAAVLMHYYHEMSVKDIAEAQRVSEGTVKSRLNYARKSLKKSVEDYEKKHDVKLHCVGVLPLLLWLFASAGKEVMPVAAAKTVAGGVAAATGTTIALSTGGVAAATATATATAGAGLVAKIAALPVAVKIISGITAAALLVGSVGITVSQGNNQKDGGLLQDQSTSAPTTAENETTEHSAKDPSLPNYPTINPGDTLGNIVPAGCTYTMNDGTVLTEGEIMPMEMTKGEFLTTEYYTYRFDGSGWRVYVRDDKKTQYGPLYSEINEVTITSLRYTFSGCTEMTTAPEIPSTVVELYSAFSECEALEVAPVIPDGVKEMYSTFKNCIELRNAPNIPEGVTDLGSTFQGCAALVNAPVIPYGVTDMSYTFESCSSLVNAPVIPSSVTDLQGAFSKCTSLTTAPIIPESVANIKFAFYGCTSLTGVIEINANLPLYIDCRNSGWGKCYSCDEFKSQCDNCNWCSAYTDCVTFTQHPIVLSGSCGELYSIALNASERNVTVDSPCTMLLPGMQDAIPDGCSYVTEDGNTYTAGQAFPRPPTDGDRFITPDYTYYFGNTTIIQPGGTINIILFDSWFPIVNDKTKSSYSGIYDSINGYYVTGLLGTFKDCKNLIIPPAIPTHVTTIRGAYEGCISMTTAPVISCRVTSMDDAFKGCIALMGD